VRWCKHIKLEDARRLSEKFCDDFSLSFCQIYFVDVLTHEDKGNKKCFFGVYSFPAPSNILILDTYTNINKIGILMHELAHHLECNAYHNINWFDGKHGYLYQLAKKRVITWCKKNISNRPDWNKPLLSKIYEKDMRAFKL
jgi:hypothetical protein